MIKRLNKDLNKNLSNFGIRYYSSKKSLYDTPLPDPNGIEFKEYNSSDYFKFEIIHQSTKSNARVTKITTPHGEILQPNFVPVGTIGSIKFLDPVSTKAVGSQLMFVNTYHMIVNADLNEIEKVGGLHSFINYQNPIITDSGGFQVFSMGHPERNGNTDTEGTDEDDEDFLNQNNLDLTKRELKGMSGKKYPGSIVSITDDGVLFKSYKSQEKITLSPESSIQYQKQLGADIIVPFDELPPYHMDQNKIIQSLHRTHHWEARSLLQHIKDPRKQAIYNVIHGGVDVDLRKQSIDYLCSLPFDGVGIGGSLGKDRKEMHSLLSQIIPMIPKDRPNHLLGIGDLESVLQIIPLGIDSFDSSYPTRAARHGSILTSDGNRYLIKKSIYKSIHNEPLEKDCDCPTCKNYSKAYIHHLFKSNEQIFYTLATQHNLRAMAKIMKNQRDKIMANEI
ncbi:hypothetical protein CYY_004417 [Polysphondylium violaceum]|uniref:tRNA-guanine(15) transglycosylase-like domain-containing protein n=1 Tax=Polysphondylium violaceum TaxID=133409 RepID=A0A8J4PX32_9MYCE|nr:hypothetical protein CYY_004417 [Polysphondylium violaceum]